MEILTFQRENNNISGKKNKIGAINRLLDVAEETVNLNA